MPNSEFDNPVVMDDGTLRIGGPLNLEEVPEAEIQNPISVRFILMQDVPQQNPTVTLIVNGTATCNAGDGRWEAVLAAGQWDNRLILSPVFDAQDGTGLCRGIAQAILVRNFPNVDPTVPGKHPPFFDAITWCVTTRLLTQAAAEAQAAA